MASVGKLSEFVVKNGNWSSYVDRLDMYFLANGVKDDMKLPILIATIGEEAYELLLNLANPKKPKELSYIEAIQLMQNHLQPCPSALAERFRFRQRRQNLDESVAGYVAELKRLSRYCKFGNNLSENLRDQFVCGLRSEIIRQRLFTEDDSLTFNGAVKVASSLEAAERDAAAVEQQEEERGAGGVAGDAGLGAGASHTAINAMAAVSRTRGGEYSRTRNNSTSAGMRRRLTGPAGGWRGCQCCGSDEHQANMCRYRDYVCSRCKKAGHLRRMCMAAASGGGGGGGPRRQREPARDTAGRIYYNQAEYLGEEIPGPVFFGGTEYPSEDPEGFPPTQERVARSADSSFGSTDETEEFLHHLDLSDYTAVSLPILVGKIIIKMEVDTGSALSCISEDTYKRYFRQCKLEPCTVNIKFYDGSKIRPLGKLRVDVEFKNKRKVLDLYVIEGGGTTSLLGRQWLAELEIDVPKFTCKCNQLMTESKDISNDISVLLRRYKELFDGGLGRYTGGRATLSVREGAEPMFVRARPVPYALRERIDAELDKMLRAGVIEPVDSSDWASPIVPVPKPDGALRICADYKSTLNPVLRVDRFPLPRIDDILVGLNGAQFFSKIDLTQAYNQIELDESCMYTVINTHRGLFRYKRLVYGLSSSPGIFQRIMTNLLGSIPNVQVFLDDIIIGGKSKEEHLRALDLVFRKLNQNGLKLKLSKCVFLTNEVSYLGYIVSREGIKADTSKVEAIKKMQKPQNVSELRSFLGLVNFYSKFIKNFSSRLVPLYNLLRKGVEWHWSQECERTFQEIKSLLTSTEVLAHYVPTKPLILTCDASARGIGGVLSQPGARGERPVAYVSRTLTEAEKNYSQIHREALAIIFCVKKLHQYLYGRKFILRTDHKPLVSIFGPNKGIPTMAASRMQRWAIILSAYDFDVVYVRTTENSADGLSRLPIKNNKIKKDLPEQTYLHFAQEALLLSYQDIKKQTSTDTILSRVLSYIRDGWPEYCDITALQPYWNRRKELYEELGCIMWGRRVVIPGPCRDKVIKTIHEPHMGIVKSKALARSYVWWPGVDESIEAACRACTTCGAHADAPPQQVPRPWPWPTRPWSRLHIDFLGPIFGKIYLVVVDAMSKWVEIFNVPSTAAGSTISKLRELWGRFGIPKQIVSDNGPPFTGQEFARFLKENNIEHIFTAPYHPSSNGAAENSVKTLKRVIKKAKSEQKDVDLALNLFLLYYRNTEHTTTGESPAMLMFGRSLRTHLDLLKPDLEQKVRLAQTKQIIAAGGVERSIKPGDDVWYKQFLKAEKWAPGRVISARGDTDFIVETVDGIQKHRHANQLKQLKRSSLVVPVDPRHSHASGEGGGHSELAAAGSGTPGRDPGPTPPRSVPSPIEYYTPTTSRNLSAESSPRVPTTPSSSECVTAGVPSQTTNRPIRQCRLYKVPNYKY